MNLMYPMRVRPLTSYFVLHTFCSLLVAQSPLAFDVASIKSNNSGAMGESVRFFPPSGRVTMTNVTVRRLILNAYQLQDQQLSGGPGWIDSEHFDIVANSDATNLTPQQRWMMVRALLMERFKLKVHSEAREIPVFALVLARSDGRLGSALRKSEAADCTPPRRPKLRPDKVRRRPRGSTDDYS